MCVPLRPSPGIILASTQMAGLGPWEAHKEGPVSEVDAGGVWLIMVIERSRLLLRACTASLLQLQSIPRSHLMCLNMESGSLFAYFSSMKHPTRA